MKIGDIRAANDLYTKLKDIDLQITHVGTQGGLGVTIQGTYQNDDLVDHVRPLVLGVLRRRREQVLRELEQLGAK